MKTTIVKSILLIVVIGIAFATIYNNKTKNSTLGSFDSPDIALIETQKALTAISIPLNRGMKSVMYIHEFELAKNKIFIDK